MKRVVLEQTVGPRAGLRTIGGRWEMPFPLDLGPFTVHGRKARGAKLVKIEKRWILYREVAPS